jgi:hypothetical protein
VLKPADLLAEGWLSDVQAVCGAAKVEFLSHRDEVLDATQVEPFHRHSLLIVR